MTVGATIVPAHNHVAFPVAVLTLSHVNAKPPVVDLAAKIWRKHNSLISYNNSHYTAFSVHPTRTHYELADSPTYFKRPDRYYLLKCFHRNCTNQKASTRHWQIKRMDDVERKSDGFERFDELGAMFMDIGRFFTYLLWHVHRTLTSTVSPHDDPRVNQQLQAVRDFPPPTLPLRMIRMMTTIHQTTDIAVNMMTSLIVMMSITQD
ncbi:hypothetical protein E4T56_gene14596 [Termitomyces sp. T112]|nr:hypothetical protein E4T56_gene14596 [Termitomyces sp. T112]KAH0583430.1 hypothetical protein H2248_009058 [Termitomyces sp. 'cryptogamus']